VVNAFVALVWLLFGHAVTDFALQTEFVVRGKNRHTDIGKSIWKTVLSAHAATHGASVGLVLHGVAGTSWAVATLLGLAEFASHWLIDFGKCDSRYSFNADQAFHVACKLAWVVVVFLVLLPAGIV
jgi:hypothetical protein